MDKWGHHSDQNSWGTSGLKHWVLKGDVLEISDGETRVAANADQVYTSVVKNNPAWIDLPAGKCGDAKFLTFSSYPVELRVVISANPESGHPVLTFEAETQENKRFPVSEVAMKRGHVVYNGTWHPAWSDSSECVAAMLKEAGFDPQLGAPRTLRGFLHLKRAASYGEPVVDKLTDDILKKLSLKERATEPKGIQAQLYPYQVDGWRWLRFVLREQLGGLLADEMGLGKTLQVISALRDPGGNAGEGAALVVVPSSLLENWVREISNFCPEFRVLKHSGPMRTGRPAELQGFDVIIVSYDTAVRDLSLLQMISWNIVILDEAQNIRNPDARRTKSVKQIKRNVGLAVTGTPIENRLRDLWSIMDFVIPGYLGELRSFETRYAEDKDAAAKLEPLVTPLILRRRVADVASDLPKRIDIPEFLELTNAEAVAYEKMRADIYENYGNAATLVSLVKLRQYCSHPSIIENRRHALDTEFSKFERTKELLEEIFSHNEKALIFTSYTKMADLLSDMATREFGVMSAILDGRLDAEKRQPLIDSFSHHDGSAVLVLNPRAGGVGLNITAANHVIHYNPEWNPALEDQASARAYRHGQQLPVTVRRLIFAGTVEEVIDQRLQRKRTIADTAVIGVGGREDDYADILLALERSPLRSEE